jgi:hypothetical protein
MKEEDMKNLGDSELLELAWKHVSFSDKHFYATIVLMVVATIQSTLLLFNFFSLVSFCIIYPTCFLLYFYHKSKAEKHLRIVDNLVKELISREI